MLELYVEKLQQVLARNSLRTIRDNAIASGSLKKGEPRRLIRRIERQARGKVQAHTPRSVEEAKAIYAAMGIEVVSSGE